MVSVLALGGPGCSTIVDPDEGRLDPPTGSDGGGVDGGAVDGGGDPGVDGGPPPIDGGGGCVPSCEGSTLTRCEGDRPVVETCTLPCATEGARCGEMIPSNVSAELWTSEARDVVVAGTARFDTSTCMSTMSLAGVVPQGAGPSVCVLQVRNLRVESGAELSVTGSLPLAILATGDVEIRGTLDASAALERPGPGGGAGGRPGAIDGSGWGPGRGGARMGSFDDGGGGGGGLCGAGGSGGAGGDAAGGMGGAATDAQLLIPLRGGSGGGLGLGATGGGAGATGTFGLGGAGGGGVQISALGRIRIEGAILVGGGGGRAGRSVESGNWGAGGGGGSGGGILLEAPEVVFEGSATLGATGGGGGGSASALVSGDDGEDGRVSLTSASGGEGGGAEYGAAGGDSGGGEVLEGRDGESNETRSANGGGGGGGAGCIVVRTAEGTLPPGIEDGWSPSADGVFVARVLVR
ncbi:Glycine-rich cell wall structural protein [Sandaracinus amylolyticus]|nr:Glycine-rich cell wall structural protein [Sandaracinus amylolyticus]